MDRRSLLMAAGLGAIAPSALAAETRLRPKLVKPPMLRPGDKVAIVTPSTPIYDPLAEARARDLVAAMGLNPVVAPYAFNRSRAFKASVRERLSDLHGAFNDPTIKGVFCSRGGYGVSEIVAEIDYGLIGAHPKVFLGFSDITLLHLAIQRIAGVVTFHGHMPSQSKFTPYSLAALKRAVMAAEPLGVLKNPDEAYPLRPTYPQWKIAPGVASGRLVGGNLSMIMAAMGTPWEIDTRDAILFLEDVDEHPYAMERMLLTLKHAGKFKDAAGVVMGACADCDKVTDVSPYGLNEAFDLVLGDLGKPVHFGLALGHTDEQLTVPEGVQARLDATAGTLTVLEAGVVG